MVEKFEKIEQHLRESKVPKKEDPDVIEERPEEEEEDQTKLSIAKSKRLISSFESN